ncbi:MAG: indolepyruvate ferredoxin oxidoreductase family protein [Steroidobacteraceae bacterium]
MSLALPAYCLEDRYTRRDGRVFLTGTQALVRVLLDQARRDREAGLATGGFVSGYRGSPLGALDLELWRVSDELRAQHIEFLPAVNEDLAATAILGTQQVETNPRARVRGAFAMWYGKGPGVDRSGDALKHGNAYGSSPHGGVLVVAGDDHGCVSSSMPHQSDVAFMSWFMPTLNPANVAEYLAFGEYGYALSRFSGMWVGFKAIAETVESGQSVELAADRRFIAPQFQPPPDGLHYRWPDLPGPQIEERLEAKKNAVYAFTEANPIDRSIYDVSNARFGIVTTGKAHLDLMEALRLLGLDGCECRRLGIDIYKVGLVWPLPRRPALDFVRGKEEVLVVEEKRGIIESQLKEYFYDWPGDKPKRMVGKNDESLSRLVPWVGELTPQMLLPIVARRLDRLFPDEGFPARAKRAMPEHAITLQIPGATRTAYFCSGCPHNTSTRVPEGSQALAGIGCHFMASWMDRNTTSLIQMGGEGVNWAASSRFTGRGHVFQNLGEGTWYHSGSMAIRQAIAAGANITYKILFNDAVAMTGGQPVDGPVSVQAIASISRAEGAQRIAVVSDEPGKFTLADFPSGTTLHHRRELDALQRELRECRGVSILIYEQTCATEKRRRRKRALVPDPQRHVVINELVCEGCGDCSVASNCLSVEPIATEFGTKRRVNLSTCNKDYSCLDGFCPSFVTIEGERLARRAIAQDFQSIAATLVQPALADIDEPYNLLVTGVGGTGVITVGALIAMAAHISGNSVSVLDFTGFAQKFGPVLSYIRIASSTDLLNQVRIDPGQANAVIGCDIVVSSSPKASCCYRSGTRIALNLAEMPTGDLVRHRDAMLRVAEREQAIAAAVGQDCLRSIDANQISEKLFGDSVFANVLMLGFAWQQGLVPVPLDAIERAIELNAVAVAANRAAFAAGRLIAANHPSLAPVAELPTTSVPTVAELVDKRAQFLAKYQSGSYALRFRSRIDDLYTRLPGELANDLAAVAARSLFKLMAYKDEYEVARLHLDAGFRGQLGSQFAPGFRIRHHLAPPLFARGKDARGRPLKREFGGWMRMAFRLLAPMKRLRGTVFDPFGHTVERRMERALIDWYEKLLGHCAAEATLATRDGWMRLLALPMEIRGYGQVKAQAAAQVRSQSDQLLATLQS